MALDWNQLLNTINTGVNFGTTLLRNPAVQTLSGAGLLAASTNQKPPGYVDESTQYLRNRLSPTGLGDQFTSNLGALSKPFQPLLDQQANELLNNVQQRMIAGQPSSFSTAMGGPEILAIRNAATRDILPRQQAFLGDLALKSLDLGSNAAGTLLNYGATQKNALSEGLGALGQRLLSNGFGIGNGGSIPGFPMTGAVWDAFSGQSPDMRQVLGLISGGSPASQVAYQGFANQLSQLLGGAKIGAFEDIGNGAIGVLDESGKVIASIGPNGRIVNQVTGVTLNGTATTSLMSSILPFLQIGGGAFLTSQAANLGQNQFQAGGIGAAGGALAGSAFGPIGTAIGAVAGGLFGLFGESKQNAQEKAYNLNQDNESQLDQIKEIQYIGNEFAQQFGIDPTQFNAYASQLISTYQSPADEQLMLSQALGSMLRSKLGETAFAQAAPQLRQRMLDYLLRSTFSAPNSQYTSGAPENLIATWTQAALN